MAQLGKCAVSVALVHVTVQCRRLMSLCRQVVRQHVGVAFGGGEDNRLLQVFITEQMVQEPVLVGNVIDIVQPLFDVEGIRLVSLQKDLIEMPPMASAALHETKIVHLGDELTDFADTAAVMANLDLVISIDTASAHLAASLVSDRVQRPLA